MLLFLFKLLLASLRRDENKEVDDYAELKEKVENFGICCNSVTPEEYTRLMCPKVCDILFGVSFGLLKFFF